MKNVRIVKDDVAKIIKEITRLTGQQVLVGVPDSKTERDDTMTNAALAYIHDNGSPAANIPPRPFMAPGIKNAEKPIAANMKKAVNAALDNDQRRVDAALNSAGLAASSSVREAVEDGDFVPLSPSTIANRYRQRGTKGQREGEKAYQSLIDQGIKPEQAQAQAGIHPLVNTGEMRNSITYVLRKK